MAITQLLYFFETTRFWQDFSDNIFDCYSWKAVLAPILYTTHSFLHENLAPTLFYDFWKTPTLAINPT